MPPDPHHLTPAQVADYLHDSLAPTARAEVGGHLEQCAQCREELIEVGTLAADYPGEVPARLEKPVRVRRGFVVPLAVAIAAGLAALVIVRQVDPPSPPVVRAADIAGSDEDLARIAVLSPPDQASVAAPIIFRWRPRGSSSYRVILLSADGKPLWSIETTDTTAQLPAAVGLEPAAAYFWRVDAIGNGIVASSGVQRLQSLP